MMPVRYIGLYVSGDNDMSQLVRWVASSITTKKSNYWMTVFIVFIVFTGSQA